MQSSLKSSRSVSRALLAKRRAIFVFLIFVFSLIFGTLIIVMGLSRAVEDSLRERYGVSERNVFVVEKTGGIIGELFGKKSEQKFSSEHIQKFSNINGVEGVYRGAILKIPATLSFEILGRGAETDAFFMGLESSFFENIPAFSHSQETLPILVSRQTFDAIDRFIFSQIGLKNVGVDMIKDLDLDIEFGRSSILGTFGSLDIIQKEAKIVDFAQEVPFIFLAMPLEDVKTIVQDVQGKEIFADQLFVEYSASVAEEHIASLAGELGFEVRHLDEKIHQVSSLIRTISGAVYVALGVLLLFSVIIFLQSIRIMVYEQSETLQTMWTVGVSQNRIAKVFMVQMTFVFLVANIFGVLIAYFFLREIQGVGYIFQIPHSSVGVGFLITLFISFCALFFSYTRVKNMLRSSS